MPTHENEPAVTATPRQKRRGLWWVTKWALGLFCAMLLALVFLNFRILPGPNSPMVPVSKETTWITEPLNSSGDVDYLAWTNDRLKIPAEENALVAMLDVLGPDSRFLKVDDGAYELLGMNPPAVDGDYLEPFVIERPGRAGLDFSVKVDGVELDSYQVIFASEAVPFLETDFPELADWLKRNERHLNSIRSAAQLPSIWSPRVGKNLADSGFSHLLGLRDLSKLLLRSSMLHLGRNEASRAIDDQLAAIRLGRLAAKHGSLTEFLVGVAIESLGQGSLALTVASGKCSEVELERIIRELDSMQGPPVLLAEHVDLHRAEGLDAMLLMGRARYVSTDLSAMEFGKNRTASTVLSASIDWPSAFRAVNELYDRLEACYEVDDAVLTTDMLAQLRLELAEIDSQGFLSDNIRLSLLGGPDWRGRFVGQSFAADSIRVFFSMHDTEQRLEARNELTRALIAIERFRLKTGTPPGELQDLVPEFLPAVPLDPFGNQPLVYRSDPENGYLLYSLGPNQIDDNGIGWNKIDAKAIDLPAVSAIRTLDQWVRGNQN